MVNSNEDITVTLYIVRHGECNGNVAQKFIDPFTDNLTAVGRAQAELLANHLKDVSFTGAYSSDYPRAEQTAKAVLQDSNFAKENGVELTIDIRLRERDYTGIIGVHAKDAVNIIHEAMKKGTSYKAIEVDNCETIEQFEERIVSFFSELINNLQQKSSRDTETILIVSHGLTIQRLMMLLNTRPNLFGISDWTNSPITERQMRNTTYHKLSLRIPRIHKNGISGFVESAHCREHTDAVSTTDMKHGNVQDTGNYSFLEQTGRTNTSLEEETVHFCKPV